MPKLLTFAQALDRSSKFRHRHLLLGNGFSIACKPDIFAYGALFDQAEFPQSGHLTRDVFEVLGTHDFEAVMKALRDASKIVRSRDPKYHDLADELMQSVLQLRDILVSTIARQHPELPAEIPEDAYRACRTFLSHFQRIYTLNYDLLLYWALMQSELPPTLTNDDGFRAPEEGTAAYVTWEIEKSDQQNVFYLHGALHIFDAGAELQKYTWINTGIRLIEQVRDALRQDLFPLIVAEGTSSQKKAKIVHSNYLSRGYRSLPKITGCLFIHGHSLAANDEHILRLVERSKVDRVFVSIHGDPSSSANRAIADRGKTIGSFRKDRQVDFYDADTARAWG